MTAVSWILQGSEAVLSAMTIVDLEPATKVALAGGTLGLSVIHGKRLRPPLHECAPAIWTKVACARVASAKAELALIFAGWAWWPAKGPIHPNAANTVCDAWRRYTALAGAIDASGVAQQGEWTTNDLSRVRQGWGLVPHTVV